MSDHKIEKLIKIMDELREKCPWDKKQTIQSLRHLTIEEVYELSESIQNQNYDEIKIRKVKKIKPLNYEIPSDISSSAFFIVLSAYFM